MPPTPFDFGHEFRNLASSRPVFAGTAIPLIAVDVEVPLWVSRVETAERNASGLQQQANQLFESGGGYLYFPPGRYLVGRSGVNPSPGIEVGEFADIVIPENVTLWFAPGATLIPISYMGDAGARREVPGLAPGSPEHEKTRVEIRGDILADIRPIFDVFADNGLVDHPAGRILLTSQRIRAVYPEWWGAFSENPGDGGEGAIITIQRTTRAVQAAMEAAYVWRTTPERTTAGALRTPRAWHRRPAIPVVALGTYVLHEPINVSNPVDSSLWREAEMPSVDAGGFELRGERSPSSNGHGSPNFLASLHPSVLFSGQSMLNIGGVLGFSIRGVTFNGRHQARRCVTVSPTRARFSYAEFDSCTFLNPAAVAVALDARLVPPGEPTRDFWNQLFNRCRFDQGGVDALAPLIGLARRPEIRDVEGNLVGVELRLDDNEGVEFRTTAFFGHASPAIRAYSGRFSINEGNLHVLRAKHPALAGLPPERDPRFSPNFRHGTDIFLESDDEPGSARPRRIIPAAFTARELESQSWQFLASEGTTLSEGTGPMDGNHSSVILMNMHHSAVWNRKEGTDPEENWKVGESTVGPPTPPGIFWGEPGRQGSHLIMIGCEFYGQYVRYRVPPQVHFLERSVVYIAAGIRGDIYNVGSHTIGSHAIEPPPIPLTPNTQNFLIRIYDPAQWHRVPTVAMIEAIPTIDLTRIRQLVPRTAVSR